MDVFLVILSLPVTFPVVLVAAVLVRRDGGPAFYSQERVGQNGRSFRLWKLRSMVRNADEVLERVLAENPDMRAEWDEKQKLTDDPRITKIGGFIRKTSLDELPQLWNVICGDMSLVGPRPVIEAEVKKYGHASRYLLSQRPGLTGLWQVSGRNDVDYSTRVTLDAAYARKRGMLLDVIIIAKTFKTVLNKTGM